MKQLKIDKMKQLKKIDHSDEELEGSIESTTIIYFASILIINNNYN